MLYALTCVRETGTFQIGDRLVCRTCRPVTRLVTETYRRDGRNLKSLPINVHTYTGITVDGKRFEVPQNRFRVARIVEGTVR